MHEPRLILGDCNQVLETIEPNSIDMIVESPPYYNARPEYSEWNNYDLYLQFMREHLEKCFRCLKPEGRIAVNVPMHYGRINCIPFYADIVKIMLDINYKLRGTIIWDKIDWMDISAWGSWRLSSNPSLVDGYEVIIVCHKEIPRITKGDELIAKDSFMENTRSVWRILPESNRKHPAPFPIEIPWRLIELYTNRDMLVLDPFSGSATTCLAAMRLGRRSIGIEKDDSYYRMGVERIYQEYAPVGLLDAMDETVS